MKALLTIITTLLLLWNGTLVAQFYQLTSFGSTTGKEDIFSVKETPKGNLIVAGDIVKTGANDAFIAKVTPCGNVEWKKEMRGLGNDRIRMAIPTSDGGVLFTGATEGFGSSNYDAFLVKTDSNGTVQWSRSMGGSSYEFGYTLIEEKNAYIWSGSVYSYGNGLADLFVIKLDKSGNTIWQRAIGASHYDHAHTMIKLSNGNYAISGSTRSFGGSHMLHCTVINSLGNIVWSNYVGGFGTDGGRSLTQLPNGNIACVGHGKSYTSGGDDIFLNVFTSAGNLVFSKSYGGIKDESGLAIKAMPDSTLMIAGYTKTFGAGASDALLLNVSTSGKLNWAKTYGNTGNDGPQIFDPQKNIEINANGKVILGYQVENYHGDENAVLITFDKAGLNKGCWRTVSNVTTKTNNINASRAFVSSRAYTSSKLPNISLVTTATTDSVHCSFYPSATFDTSCVGYPTAVQVTEKVNSVLWGNSDTLHTTTTSVTGAFPYQITINGCVYNDTLQITNKVNGKLSLNLGNDTIFCSGDSVIRGKSYPGASYLWSTGDTTSTLALDSGVYIFSITQGSCSAIDTVVINNHQFLLNLGSDTSICQGDTLDLTTQDSIAAYIWNDQSTGKQLRVYSAGKYHVTETNKCGILSDSISITIQTAPSVNLGSDTVLCSTNNYTLELKDTNGVILWDDQTSTKFKEITYPKNKYWVTLSNKCGISNDTLHITYHQPISLNLGGDTTLCLNDSLILIQYYGPGNYKWHNGDSDSSTIVHQAEKVWLQIENQCGSVSDSMHVHYATPKVNLGQDTLICHDKPFNLFANSISAQTYFWNTGDTSAAILISSAGTYWVQIKDSIGCQALDTIEVSIKECVGLSERGEPISITKIYPNPVVDQLIIETDGKDWAVFQLFNSAGKLVQTQSLETTSKRHSIKVNTLPKGSYHIVLINSNGEQRHAIILKQ